MNRRAVAELAAPYFKERGLFTHVKSLGLSLYATDETEDLHPSLEPRAGILIPYFDRRGKKRQDIFRVRYLEEPSGFKVKKPIRYSQPAGTPPAAYLPLLVDWNEVFSDEARRIIITEGEFKAACACAHGFPTIGLGGVYSFQSTKRGVDFLPELEEVGWKERQVYIVYDSDVISKPEVQQAMNLLCSKLTARGAVPKVVRLPASVYGGDDKMGLDDFLVKFGPVKFEQLLSQAEEYAPSQLLWEFNARYAVNLHGENVVDLNPKKKNAHPIVSIKYNFFERGGYDPTRIVGPRGGTLPVAKLWCAWPHRREITGLDYLPGEGEHIDETYNTWPGWGIQPQKGDVRPFLKLLEHLIPQADRRKWFLGWLAYPLRHPGTKMYSAAVLWGRHQGTGKSFVGYVMKEIYGQNFKEISSERLHDTFNDWQRFKQFVMVDEAAETPQAVKETSSALKRLITEESVIVNEKHIKQYTLRNTINYYFTSNQANCLKLDTGDRRFFIHEVTAGPLPEGYGKLDRWLHGGGPAAWFYYLLREADVGDFNPKAHAMTTADKSVMAELNETTTMIFVRELMADTSMRKTFGDLYAVPDLQRFFEQRYNGQRADNVKNFALALANVGITKLAMIPVPDHPRQKYITLYPLFDAEKWHRTRAAEWAVHYMKSLKLSGQVTEPANM